MTPTVTPPCLIRDADTDEAAFTDLLVVRAGLDVEVGRRLRIEAHPAAETFFTRLGACREGTVPPDPETPFDRALFSSR